MADVQPDDPPPPPPPPPRTSIPMLSKSSKWLTLSVGSGAFASLNGLFAKLTTTAQTHNMAMAISGALGFDPENRFIELLLRAFFFGLNLLSNAIMWILFTRALTAATSTTRVAILNTSANFVVTAVLGMAIFAEGLPFTWWLGACFLIAGSVVIGRREGEDQQQQQQAGQQQGESVPLDSGIDGSGSSRYTDDEDEDAEGLEADTVAKTLGAGGVEQDVLAEGRFRDDSDAEELFHDDDDDDYEEHATRRLTRRE